nr:MAG TPA: hypothetical protein [Caudoviricetes sp.]
MNNKLASLIKSLIIFGLKLTKIIYMYISF